MPMAQSTPSKSLPLSTSPSLHVTQATDAERLTCWTLNSVHWGGNLALPTYIQRREHLGEQPATRDGKLTTRSSPAGTGRLVEEAVCQGVGRVFCREEFRGRGYGGRMMEELRRELLKQTNTNLDADAADRSKPRLSILYSDLGRYLAAFVFPEGGLQDNIGAAGYYPAHRRLTSGSMPCRRGSPTRSYGGGGWPRRIIIHSGVAARHRFVVAPNKEMMQWHHAHEESAALLRLDQVPEVKGAMVAATEEKGGRVWAIWTRTFSWETNRGGVLFVQRFVFEEGEEGGEAGKDEDACRREMRVMSARQVLHAAQVEAAQWGIQHVEIWNPPRVVVEAVQQLLPNAEVVHRQHDIPSLMWCGKDMTGSEVEWMANERYAWC